MLLHDGEIPTTAYEFMPVIERLRYAHHKDTQNSKGEDILDVLSVKTGRRLKFLNRAAQDELKAEDDDENNNLTPLLVSRKRDRDPTRSRSPAPVSKHAKKTKAASPASTISDSTGLPLVPTSLPLPCRPSTQTLSRICPIGRIIWTCVDGY
ncbi:hypothetical protein DL95DRAFT_471446 [Leptodontidium sp. 2 PMI_412]|nr:hypothetical protein DL95DRAFT_471446 [Leptodontidium sp. 2 PMI_412]